MQSVLARIARVRSGNFGIDGTFIVVLLCGGDKSSQSKDIENAKKYWSDYQERKEYEQR